MAINKKSFLAEIKRRVYKHTPVGVVSSAKKLIKDKKAQYKSEKKAKQSKTKLVDTESKKAFVAKYGEIAYNKAMDKGSLWNPNQHKYGKTRKKVEAKYSGL